MQREESENHHRLALGLIIAGLAMRLALLAISQGTADAATWRDFGAPICSDGLIAVYRADPNFNHPPFMGWFAGLAYSVSRATGLPFPVLFKLPSIIADAITCALLWRINSRTGPWLAALFAWNLNSILVSAHHCNTDSIYAMLCLASAYMIEARAANFIGGLILGAAVNVKLIPMLLVFPTLALCRDRKSFARSIAGLAMASIPFWWVLIFAGREFAAHALGYVSFIDNWGIELFVQRLSHYPHLSTTFGPAIEAYQHVGRIIMVAAVVLMSMVARRRAWDRYFACAIAASIFLIFTPGFGIQYTALVAPLLLAASPVWGVLYVMCASALALCWYGLNWDGGFPISNPPGIQLHGATMIAGLFTWIALVLFVAQAFLRARENPRQSRGLSLQH